MLHPAQKNRSLINLRRSGPQGPASGLPSPGLSAGVFIAIFYRGIYGLKASDIPPLWQIATVSGHQATGDTVGPAESVL